MSPVRLTALRTIGLARNARITALVFGAFLAAVAARFVYSLGLAEGGRTDVAVVWGMAVAPILPILAALVGMDSWSGEHKSGRIDMLMSLPVSEYELAIGKFIGVWTVSAFAVVLSLLSAIVSVSIFATLCRISIVGFAVVFLILMLQLLLWCAIANFASAFFRNATLAACVTVLATVVAPRGIWMIANVWSGKIREQWGEFPLDANLVDMMSGVVSGSAVISYVMLTVVIVFATVVTVMLYRMIGVGAKMMRTSARSAVLLLMVAAILMIVLANRVDFTIDVQSRKGAHCSERTRGILSRSYGEVSAICFVSRSDVRFREVAHTLRSFAGFADDSGGIRMALRFVDPTWDYAESSELIRSGVGPGSVILSTGRRRIVLAVSSDDVCERAIASSILQLTMPAQRRNVYWTRGHGEVKFDDYGDFGMSDMAREINRDGYLNQYIDLAASSTIPSDCALVVIAGARDEFSRTERDRLMSYLRRGGRLLVLTNNGEAGGMGPMLAEWGISSVEKGVSGRTISGSELIITEFANHPVTEQLAGSCVIMDSPLAFAPSAAVATSSSADHIRFTALAKNGSDCVAAIVERGDCIGDDLGIRPTRIVAIGDSSFVMNAPLSNLANANREFFLNVISYLSGTDAITPGGTDVDVLTTGMDRSGRYRMIIATAVVFPLLIMTILVAIAWHRRSRR